MTNIFNCPDLIKRNKCNNVSRIDDLCSKNPNCKFKLQKELEQLQKENELLKTLCGLNDDEIVNELAWQTMVLKDQNEQLDNDIRSQQQENIELTGQLIDAEEKLDEITKIIEEDTNSCFYDSYECEECDRNHFCLYYGISEILEEQDD